MEIVDVLSAAEKKRIRIAVEKALEQYRIFYSILNIEEDEPCFYKEQELMEIRNFCKRVDNAVNELPSQEKTLITERYMHSDSEYITDSVVYDNSFNPPISERTYSKYREKAMYKLAFLIGVNCKVFNFKSVI